MRNNYQSYITKTLTLHVIISFKFRVEITMKYECGSFHDYFIL